MATHACATILIILLKLHLSSTSPASGKYNLTVLSMGECPEKMSGTNEVQFKTRIGKTSRDNICYSGWINLPYGLNDDDSEFWEISVQGSTGGWKSNFLTFDNKKACSGTKRLFPEWFKVLKAANLNDTSCPIPPGNYSFGCFDLNNVQFTKSDVFFYGKYRVTVHYYHNKVKIGCTMYVGEIRPREILKRDQPHPKHGSDTNLTTIPAEVNDTMKNSQLSTPSPTEFKNDSTISSS